MLPHAEQKIEILNAYLGQDPWDLEDHDRRNFEMATSLTEHAVSELGIEDQMKDIKTYTRKLDKVLKYILCGRMKPTACARGCIHFKTLEQ